jgi:hypothetical protein
MKTVTYNSSSPVFRYNTGLRYGQLVLEKGKSMARAKGGLHLLTIGGLLQYLQNLITAATGNPNAPTPFPSIVTLQGLLDAGVDKVNAVAAAEDQLAMLRGERDAQLDTIRASIILYIATVESLCGGDPVKLQSFGLALRSPASPATPCETVTGLLTNTGDDETAMTGRWNLQPQASSYEVQSSPDPLTPSSWRHEKTVTESRVTLTGLPSGEKRWMRVRAVNRQGPGSWSDPSCRMIP